MRMGTLFEYVQYYDERGHKVVAKMFMVDSHFEDGVRMGEDKRVSS